ncbi:MAG: MATE family efflux transporter [Planctomycetes bacterium]|nr:MATE family efflux transporter [Planctomycetota bacterium]
MNPNPPKSETESASSSQGASNQGEIRSGRLAGKSIYASIWIVAMPVLVQQTMQACVGMVDLMLSGRLEGESAKAAMDAIGVGSYVTWFILIAMTGLGIGGQAIIARAMGSGNRQEAHYALGQALMLSALWGVVVGATMWFGIGPLAQVCQLSEQVTQLLIQYTHVIAVSLPAAGVMLVGAMCLYGAGETMLPSIIAIAVNAVNLVVSWALSGVDFTIGKTMIENPFTFDMGLVGIAAGTSICYCLGAILTLWVAFRGVKDLKLSLVDLKLNRPITRRLIRVGLPGFFDSLMMWLANLFVLIFIGMIAKAAGENGLTIDGLQGAHIIAIRWEAFSFLPGFAIGTAAGTLAGQFLGANNPQMAQRSIVICTVIASVMMGLFGLVFIFGGEMLTRIISSDELHLKETPPILLIGGSVQVFFAINLVIRQGLRGVGDTRWTFLITTVSSYAIRLPVAWFFGVYLQWGLTGIWIGLSGELSIRALLFLARFLHGGWKSIEV